MKLYTLKEAAEILGYKEGSLRNKVMRKEIKTIRLGRSVRFTEHDLEEFIGLKIVDGKLTREEI